MGELDFSRNLNYLIQLVLVSLNSYIFIFLIFIRWLFWFPFSTTKAILLRCYGKCFHFLFDLVFNILFSRYTAKLINSSAFSFPWSTMSSVIINIDSLWRAKWNRQAWRNCPCLLNDRHCNLLCIKTT